MKSNVTESDVMIDKEVRCLAILDHLVLRSVSLFPIWERVENFEKFPIVQRG